MVSPQYLLRFGARAYRDAPAPDRVGGPEIRRMEFVGPQIGHDLPFPTEHGKPCGWLSPWHYGINEGPIVLMIENHRTGFLWNLMRQCPYIVSGLRKAGFTGGWL